VIAGGLGDVGDEINPLRADQFRVFLSLAKSSSAHAFHPVTTFNSSNPTSPCWLVNVAPPSSLCCCCETPPIR